MKTILGQLLILLVLNSVQVSLADDWATNDVVLLYPQGHTKASKLNDHLSPTGDLAIHVKGKPRGQWQNGESYEPSDIIDYAGSYYICLNSHISDGANLPPNKLYWEDPLDRLTR